MTKAATLTQANIARAIRAAESTGKVAFFMPGGIAFLDPEAIVPEKGAEIPRDDQDPFELVDLSR